MRAIFLILVEVLTSRNKGTTQDKTHGFSAKIRHGMGK